MNDEEPLYLARCPYYGHVVGCDINTADQDLRLWWSFELTTEKFEMRVKQDSHHVKSYWRIVLPEPESTF